MDCSTSTVEFLKMKWLIGSLYNVDNFFGPDSNDGTHILNRAMFPKLHYRPDHLCIIKVN